MLEAMLIGGTTKTVVDGSCAGKGGYGSGSSMSIISTYTTNVEGTRGVSIDIANSILYHGSYKTGGGNYGAACSVNVSNPAAMSSIDKKTEDTNCPIQEPTKCLFMGGATGGNIVIGDDSTGVELSRWSVTAGGAISSEQNQNTTSAINTVYEIKCTNKDYWGFGGGGVGLQIFAVDTTNLHGNRAYKVEIGETVWAVCVDTDNDRGYSLSYTTNSSSSGRLFIKNIANIPTNFTDTTYDVGTHDDWWGYTSMEYFGDHIFMVGNNNNIQAVSTAGATEDAGMATTDTYSLGDNATDIVINAAGIAFVSGPNWVKSFNVTNGGNITPVDTLNITGVVDIALNGNVAYAARGSSISSIDIT